MIPPQLRGQHDKMFQNTTFETASFLFKIILNKTPESFFHR